MRIVATPLGTTPSVTLLAETEGYWNMLKSQMGEGRVAGPLVHDARDPRASDQHVAGTSAS